MLTERKNPGWSAAPKVLDISPNEVHVWRASLPCEVECLQQLEATLSDDEKDRAARFHFARDREFFVSARGVLRYLTGAYSKKAPSEIRFQYAAAGKPFIATKNVCWPIKFNLSHTRGMVLYAFARDREVGIDLECRISDLAREGFAERFFSANEVEELRALPPESQEEGFFNCWTRKEAYIKARGDGLQIPLNSFDVVLRPGSPVQFLRGVEPFWNLIGFTPEFNYVGALVFRGTPCNVLFFNFDWQRIASSQG